MQRTVVSGAGRLTAAIAHALRDAGGNVIVAPDANAIVLAVAGAEARGERIAALVTAPPDAASPETILTTTEARWDETAATHLTAVFRACKAVMPHLIAHGGGAIVNVAGPAAYGRPQNCAESALDGGVVAFGAALAYDHFNDHVRVNTIVAGAGADAEAVAPVAAYLLSPEAEVMSGSLIDVGTVAYQGGR